MTVSLGHGNRLGEYDDHIMIIKVAVWRGAYDPTLLTLADLQQSNAID